MGVKTAGARTMSKQTVETQHEMRELHDFLICIRDSSAKRN